MTIAGYVDSISEEATLQCIKSWLYWFEDRGQIQVGYPGTDNYFELRKRRGKTRADIVVFRYRNSNATRKYFRRVQSIFDAEAIPHTIALTKKTLRPRAIEIVFDPYDPLTAESVLNLGLTAFGANREQLLRFDVSAHGTVRTDATGPSVDLYLPPSDRRPSVLGHNASYGSRLSLPDFAAPLKDRLLFGFAWGAFATVGTFALVLPMMILSGGSRYGVPFDWPIVLEIGLILASLGVIGSPLFYGLRPLHRTYVGCLLAGLLSATSIALPFGLFGIGPDTTPLWRGATIMLIIILIGGTAANLQWEFDGH